MKFLYVPPWAMMSLNGTGSGSVEATYDANWLTDGLPLKPVRGTSANPAWTVAGTSRPCNFAAVINSNASVGTTASVSGVNLSVVQGASAGRVPFNPWAVLKDATTGALLPPVNLALSTFTFSGNSVNPLIVGQLVVGQAFELERPIQPGGRRAYGRFNQQPDPSVDGQIRVYRRDKLGRTFSGSTTATTAGMDALIDWYESTEDNQLMSVIVPDPLLPDAWAVKFSDFGYERQGPDLYSVTLSFQELPRKRW